MAGNVAGKLTIKVIDMHGAPEFVGVFGYDKFDPYVVVTLHDGKFDSGKEHRGESVKTTVKENAGKEATWNEEFHVAKPENMDILRVQLWDSDAVYDDQYGRLDVDLNLLLHGKHGELVPKALTLIKDGKVFATVNIAVQLDV